MMIDSETIKAWSWREVLRGKINSQRRNRHYNTKLLDDELRARLAGAADAWQTLVASEWEQEEEAWKRKLGQDLSRIDARAPERKQADDAFLLKSAPYFESEALGRELPRPAAPGAVSRSA